jgi:hypothetical protein
MSKPERRSPVAGADRARDHIAVAANAPDYKTQPPDVQQFRTHWLVRRARIAPEMAEAIAPMVFGREATR